VTCTGDGGERELQITAYLDGELDLTSALDLERHLEECSHCAAVLGAQRAMQQAIGKADLRFHPTAQQARRLRRAIGAPAAPAAAWWRQPQLRSLAALLLVAVGTVAGWTLGRRWPGVPAAAAVAAKGSGAATGAALPGSALQPAPPEIAEQLLASHVRGQLAGHPEDVASSDRHTVKPWFAGHIDYSPPVVDLAPQGFPLRGGRLDYVGGRPVATLVYQAGNHLVSVFVWPSGPEAGAASARGPAGGVAASTRRGFQLRSWSQSGMTWWAVSEVAADRLDELVRRLRAELPPAQN